MKLNIEVVYQLVREIAKKIREEDLFEKDPELYIVGLLISANQSLPVDPLTRSHQIINDVFERATYERIQEKAEKLLHRKKVTVK